jgi:hypothetical protein
MTADEILRLVSQVGIPAVLAGYVLVRLDATMRALDLSVRSLLERIDRVMDRLEREELRRP